MFVQMHVLIHTYMMMIIIIIHFTITMVIWFDKPPVNSSIELDELQADCKYGYFGKFVSGKKRKPHETRKPTPRLQQR